MGRGGAILVDFLPGSTLTASNLTLTNNQAIGGAGNTAGPLAGDGIGGGLVAGAGGAATISNSTIANN